MASLEGLQDRLAALQESTTQLRCLVDRLANLKFQPGSVPLGTDEESSPSGELSAEIGHLLRAALEEHELLREELKFARPEGRDKARVKDGVERLGAELASCRTAFRKARLAAKKSLEQAQRQERELLVQSFSQPAAADSASAAAVDDDATAPTLQRARRHAQLHQPSRLADHDQRTVGASSNVTHALRHTHELIAAELSRSEFAHQTLTESSDALRQLNESYTSLDSMLANSRLLLGTLLRSQKSDTWYLQTALYMLMVTAAWLVFRRILYGPVWWLVWLPLRILFGVGTRAGSAVMQGAAGPLGGAGRGQLAGAQERKVPVQGLPDDDLPIAQVAEQESGGRRAQDGDPDTVADEMGEMVDAAKGEPSAERRNTKKRMWVETPGVGGDPGTRDEL